MTLNDLEPMKRVFFGIFRDLPNFAAHPCTPSSMEIGMCSLQQSVGHGNVFQAI